MWTAPDIISTAIAVLGLIVSIVGLTVVIVQVRKARGAAEAAAEAVRDARGDVMRRVTEADLGAVVSELRGLQDRLRADQHDAALRSCQGAWERLVALRSRHESRIPRERHERLSQAISTLTRVREALEPRDGGAPVDMDIGSTNSEIEEVVELVVSWQQSSLFLEYEEQEP